MTSPLELHQQFFDMVADGPGGSQEDAAAIDRTIFAFEYCDGVNQPTLTKAREVANWLEIWRSPRKWARWGEDKLRAILYADLMILRGLIRECWPEEPSSNND